MFWWEHRRNVKIGSAPQDGARYVQNQRPDPAHRLARATQAQAFHGELPSSREVACRRLSL
jgi:hypothetical protein